MRRRHVIAIGLALLVLIAAAIWTARVYPTPREPMITRHLENAHFDPPPPAPAHLLATLWSDLWSESGEAFWRAMVPNQAGVLWIALAVVLVVAFDYARPGNARNFELLLLLSLGFLLFNVMRFFDLLADPVYFRVMDLVFTGIVAVSLALLVLAIWRVSRPHEALWEPNLSVRPLMALAVLLLTMNVVTGLATPPDDAGFYTNLGAQRLRERGKFPYGDPLLTNSAGAGYGPLLYLAHLPFQVMLDPSPVNTTQPTRADLEGGAHYLLPPPLASKLTVITFHLIGFAALVTIGLQLANPTVAWALAALYCGSAYVMGVGGPRETIGGMTFISHIAPPAVSMVAFACIARPMAAGVLLVMASATVFFPALFFPAWLGYYWHRRADALRFAGGCALAAVLLGVPVVLLSQPIEGHSLIGTVVRESVGHHQGTDTYGLSTFGFWGQRGGVRDWLREPLVSGQFTTSPMFLITIGFAAAMFFVARRTTAWQLALITAAIGIIAQWSKIHGTGVYVNWYYPFLLIGLLCSTRGVLMDTPAKIEPGRDPGTIQTPQGQRVWLLTIVAALSWCGACSSPSAPTPRPPALIDSGVSGPTTAPPSLTCPSPIAAVSPLAGPATVSYDIPSAMSGEPPVTVRCTPEANATYAVGTTIVECIATDARQRTASCTFPVTVAAAPRLQRGRIMAFGDSITTGEVIVPNTQELLLTPTPASYPSVLQALLRARYGDQAVVFNAGLSGEKVAFADRRFPSTFLNYSPDVVVLLEGANDLLYADPAAGIQSAELGMAVIAADARNRRARVFIALLTPSRPGRRHIPLATIAAANDRLRAVARGEGATVIDTFSPLLADLEANIGSDGLHPTERGYRRIAETVDAAIRAELEVR